MEIYLLFLPTTLNQYLEILPQACKISADNKSDPDLMRVALETINSQQHESIYHATYYGNASYKNWSQSGFKNVITVHDFISEKFSPRKLIARPRLDLKKKAIKSADHIICVSKTTKNDLLSLFDIEEEKISVIYLGSGLVNLNIKPAIKNSRKDFLLFVGKRDGYKNFSRLLSAFANSPQIHNNFKLIAFGGGKFNDYESHEISDRGLANKVFQLDGNDNDLAKLYSSATALIYPSLYEGFGLPPLEAMKYGCPVIASNAASIPEICHDSTIYFDPLNTEQISTTIETTLGNEDLLRSKVQLGFQNEKRFTWKKTAIETLQVYCDLFK